jgi:hypothetical protein
VFLHSRSQSTVAEEYHCVDVPRQCWQYWSSRPHCPHVCSENGMQRVHVGISWLWTIYRLPRRIRLDDRRANRVQIFKTTSRDQRPRHCGLRTESGRSSQRATSSQVPERQEIGGLGIGEYLSEHEKTDTSVCPQSSSFPFKANSHSVIPPAKYLTLLCHQVWPSDTYLPSITEVPYVLTSHYFLYL